MIFFILFKNSLDFFQDDDLVKDDLLDDQPSDEPIDSERAVRTRRRIRKTD